MISQGINNMENSVSRFERKFSNLFRLDLPPPIQFPTEKSNRNSKIFSDKFWKRRPSFKLVARNTLRLKTKFLTKEANDDPSSNKHDQCKMNQKPLSPSTPCNLPPSPSVLSLPSLTANSPFTLSTNIDECLPLSTSFSVLTISRDNLQRHSTSNEESFNTFGDRLALSTPTTMMERLAYSAPPKSNFYHKAKIGSPLPSPFETKANFYGEHYKNAPRTDFRISTNSRAATNSYIEKTQNSYEKQIDNPIKVNSKSPGTIKTESNEPTISQKPQNKKVLDQKMQNVQENYHKVNEDFVSKMKLLENTLAKNGAIGYNVCKKPVMEVIKSRKANILEEPSKKLTLTNIDINNNNSMKENLHVEYRKRSCSESYATNLPRIRNKNSNLCHNSKLNSDAYRFSVKDLVAKFDCGDCAADIESIEKSIVKTKTLLV